MAYFLSPVGNEQQFDANGNPLSGGKIFTYLASSTTPTATYTDISGGTAQANPIVLSSAGFPASPIWLNGGISYKFVIQDANGVVIRTIDNISGVNDTSASQSQWVSSGFVPTFVSATSFTVPGDQTGILHAFRRLKTKNTAGTIYSRVSASSYASPNTTVTVVNDAGVLDSGISLIEYGVISAANTSNPNSAGTAQSQLYTAFTTGGTATAVTLTPSPAITAYAAGQSFWVNFATALGDNPTLEISGVATPPNLVRELANATYTNILSGDVPVDHRSQVVMLSATRALITYLPATAAGMQTTAFSRTLLDDADAPAARATIGAEPTLLVETVLTAAVSSVAFTGLDINTHKSYRIEVEQEGVGTAAYATSMFVNNLKTQTDYYSQLVEGDGTGVAASRNNTAQVLAQEGGTRSGCTIFLTRNDGPTAHVIASRNRGSVSRVQIYNWSKTADETNITRLDFDTGVADGFQAGSKIRIYRGDK